MWYSTDLLIKKVNKQVPGVLSLIRDHGKKKLGRLKVAYTCRYTSGHSIPNLEYTPHDQIRD